SVVVVLPASMWAMMPMLRVFSSGCRPDIDAFPCEACGVIGGDRGPGVDGREPRFAGEWGSVRSRTATGPKPGLVHDTARRAASRAPRGGRLGGSPRDRLPAVV